MSLTETGLRLRLVSPCAEESLAEVRALSEGHGPQRRLFTVPFVPFTAPVARAAIAWEEQIVPRHTNNKRARRLNVKETLAAFQGTHPGEFTTNDYAAFADTLVTTASSQLRNYILNGTLLRVGKAGRHVIFKFA